MTGLASFAPQGRSAGHVPGPCDPSRSHYPNSAAILTLHTALQNVRIHATEKEFSFHLLQLKKRALLPCPLFYRCVSSCPLIEGMALFKGGTMGNVLCCTMTQGGRWLSLPYFPNVPCHDIRKGGSRGCFYAEGTELSAHLDWFLWTCSKANYFN